MKPTSSRAKNARTMAAIGLIVVSIAACGSGANTAKTVTSTVTSYQFVPTTADAATPPASSPAEPDSGERTIPGDGTFLVGSEVQPGTYRSIGIEGRSCVWKRLSGLSGGPGTTIAFGSSKGPVIVEIEATDKGFQTVDCATWEVVK